MNNFELHFIQRVLLINYLQYKNTMDIYFKLMISNVMSYDE